MTTIASHDAWAAGENYERYMGRWSRAIAAKFIDWLAPPDNAEWLEIGIGTGALTEAILQGGHPASVLGIDASEDFVRHAISNFTDDRADFRVANAQNLGFEDNSFEITTSALVLNFIPDRHAALREMHRVTRPGGFVSFYVWDYPGGGMGFIDAYWQAAQSVDPRAAEYNEASRFPFCNPEDLLADCLTAGLGNATLEPIEIRTVFTDFNEFWEPFTLGAGPAPGFYQSLSADKQQQLKDRLRQAVGAATPIDLPARAWAVKATIV